MDVILHIGAHRCASASFQHYLRQNAQRLGQDRIGCWGPWRTRSGLFQGLQPGPVMATGRDQQRRAVGRLRLHLAHAGQLGLRNLVISDENMIGTMPENLRSGWLYPSAGERMARYAHAFQGTVSDVIVNIRAPEIYWASVFGHALMRGHGAPRAALLEQLAFGPRRWRDVIADIACAVPDARIWVMPFEVFAGRPETQLGAVLARDLPKAHARQWLRPTPRLPELRKRPGGRQLPDGQGRWQPFSPRQISELRESYADDLMWLAGGADGLAWLMDDPEQTRAGMNPPQSDMTRGKHDHDQERRMARAGRKGTARQTA